MPALLYAACCAATRVCACSCRGLPQALKHCQAKHSIKFTKYDQSSKCTQQNHSSVSYASAVVMLE